MAHADQPFASELFSYRLALEQGISAMPNLSRPVASTRIATSYSPRLLHHRSQTSATNGRERESNQWAEFMDELIGPNSGPNPLAIVDVVELAQ